MSSWLSSSIFVPVLVPFVVAHKNVVKNLVHTYRSRKASNAPIEFDTGADEKDAEEKERERHQEQLLTEILRRERETKERYIEEDEEPQTEDQNWEEMEEQEDEDAKLPYLQQQMLHFAREGDLRGLKEVFVSVSPSRKRYLASFRADDGCSALFLSCER